MKNIKRSAFTLIEIVMVIVILGIVGMIGTDIISKMYQGYIRTKIVNNLQSQTELIVEQIASRLRYRVKDTVITKDTNNPTVLRPLSEDDNNTVYDMLEWIGYDNEGFLGEWNSSTNICQPGWSGFVDLDSANTDENNIDTRGSNISFAENTIKALSYNEVDLTGAKDTPAVIFKKPSFGGTPRTYGLDGITHLLSTDHNDTHPVTRVGNSILNFTEVDNNKTLIEQYYLVWSAYAIIPEQDGNISSADFNLTLHYNYQPWHDENFDDANTKKIVLAEHVSLFRFSQTGSTIRIKLCIQDGNITGTPIGFCKEKAIY